MADTVEEMDDKRDINTGGGDYRKNNLSGNSQYAERDIINYFGAPPYEPGIPFQVPPVPRHYVPRSQYVEQVRSQLLCDDANQPGTLVVSAIQGLGGIGKSVLAAALAWEPKIRDRFPDGILWVTLGQQPDLLPLLGGWIQELGDRDYTPTTAAAASSYLRSLLADKTMLLVVDDLWSSEHFEPFRLAGKGCRVLVTTREVRLSEAQRCELGVLSAEESAALLEGRLGRTLADSEREAFGEFARAVGYLPLALELAAVQIEDGDDWPTLLADLREEFDVLDINESEASDAVRRRESLRACFNLSLKRLNAEQLRRFAWLGMLPEDVSVDARMVATLWQVSEVKARKGLQNFLNRGLLLSGVAVSAGGKSWPRFRQHDLLHDLARELLGASPEAKLPGLGLSVEEAHGELLARYKSAAGDWWHLPDDGYIHARLTWHMEQAEQVREMQELIRAADADGRNAWGEACEALGLLTVFVEDVARAWRCAEEIYGVIPREAEGWRWQFWCAFAMGSMNSLVGNIPGELLAVAVRQGHWSEAKAVAYALQKRDESARSRALVALMPELQEREVVERVVQAAQHKTSMMYVGNRDQVFVAVLKNSIDIWGLDKALNIVLQMPDELNQAEALITLVEKLSSDHLDEVLRVIRQMTDDYERARVLHSLAERQSRFLCEALQKTFQIDNNDDRSMMLRVFSQRVSSKSLSRVSDVLHELLEHSKNPYKSDRLTQNPQKEFKNSMAVVRQIADEKQQSTALNWVIQNQEELSDDARDMRRCYDLKKWKEILAEIDKGVVSLSKSLTRIDQEIINPYFQYLAVNTVAKKWPDLFHEIRDTALTVNDSYRRAQILSSFTTPTSWKSIAIDKKQNLLSLLSTRERSHLIELLPKLHPTLLQLGGQPAVDAALDAMRDACKQWP